MATRDPYAVLGLSKSASADDIKSAFRKLARQYHPDVNPNNPEAEEKFKEVQQAYEILSDPDKRARFDQYGITDDQQGGGAGDFFGGGGGGFGDLFEAFFGQAGGGQQQRRRMGRDGEDVRLDIAITLEDVLRGIEKTVKYKKSKACFSCTGTGVEGGGKPETCGTCKGSGQVSRVQNTFIGQIRTATTCPNCQGSGQIIKNPCKKCNGRGATRDEVESTIKVPIGVDHGATIRYQNSGGEGVGGGANGDLYVVISVAEDSRFEREGTDLYTALDVSFVHAALGDERSLKGLAEDIIVHIPAGSQPGKVITIKEAGLPRLHGSKRGDLHIELVVTIPKKISAAQEKLLREFAELAGDDQPKGEGGSGFLGGIFGRKK
jgi:molecular chaperone DnaJ